MLTIRARRLQILPHHESQNGLLEGHLSGGGVRGVIPENERAQAELRVVPSPRKKQQIRLVKHANFANASSEVFLSDHLVVLGGEYFVALGGADSETGFVLVDGVAEHLFLGRIVQNADVYGGIRVFSRGH